MDAGYALLVEAWLRIQGMDMLTAIQRTNESLGLHVKTDTPTAGDAGPSPASAARENERALAELASLMGGLR